MSQHPTPPATSDPDRATPPPGEFAEVEYLVDAQDRIIRVTPHWEAFARANGAPEATIRPLGRSLWDFITDRTTQAIYQALLARVRRGASITLPYRCDAPALRRFMELTMEPGAAGGVRFRSRLLLAEPRKPVPLLDTSAPRERPPAIRCCSWCKRIDVQGRWQEVEVGVPRLGFLDEAPFPLLSHGICPECEDGFTRQALLDPPERQPGMPPPGD